MVPFWLALAHADPLPVRALPTVEVETVVASWYGDELRGRLTAAGLPFDPDARTAAHRTLPFGTVLRVENPANERAVRVVVIDRGPFVEGRDLDLSRAAADRLGITDRGVAEVTIEVEREGQPRQRWPFLRPEDAVAPALAAR
jgi:rare lipoprotein A